MATSSTYPVITEIWDIFESTLQNQAKRLVEDIAKHQKADAKGLWNKVRQKIKIGLLEAAHPQDMPTVCRSSVGGCEGSAIHLRCNAPCVLGFATCPRHHGLPQQASQTDYDSVDRVLDSSGNTYFVDGKGIARDKQGTPRGYVRESTLYIFDQGDKPTEV